MSKKSSGTPAPETALSPDIAQLQNELNQPKWMAAMDAGEATKDSVLEALPKKRIIDGDKFILPTDPLAYRNILIKDNVVDMETCKLYCEHATTNLQWLQPLEVYTEQEGEYKAKIATDTRDTFKVPSEELSEITRELFFNIMTNHVEPFFNAKVEWWEEPVLMLYFEGGKFEAHADAEEIRFDAKGVPAWTKVVNRDISLLLYLSDSFTGGMLSFPHYNIKINPTPGLLVAFPSSGQYLHAAEPTESGARLVLVSWLATKGSARVVKKKNPQHIYRTEFENPSSAP